MHRRLACLICAAFMTACGGSEEVDLAEKYELRVEAEAWENHMPTALLPGQDPYCTPLIVQFTVAAKQLALPTDLSATSVSVSKGTSPQWSAVASSSETGHVSATTLVGVARGCRTAAFAEGDNLTVTVHLEAAAGRADVQTTIRLYYAS